MKYRKNNKNNKYVVEFYHKNHRPQGRSDNGNRWYPTDDEKCSCCENIRAPSRQWPWDLWKHCKTKKHIKTYISEHLQDDPITQEALKMTPEKALEHITDKENHPLLIYVAKKILLNLK